MISWMQKHNRYLVWTIWVATIAFIGAGFVGWGSYNFGNKASTVAHVGDVEITQAQLNMSYSRIYNQYNEMLQGKLDEKQAKELGIVKQAFKQLETQAKVLNYAKEVGIIVSDKEILERIQSIPSFQENGIFSKEIYTAYLSSQRLKAKTFEKILSDELAIQKTIALLKTKALDFEIDSLNAAMNISDKIAYNIITEADLNLSIEDSEIQSYWETNKENYTTKPSYALSILWTDSKETQVSDAEIQSYYETNSFNYTNKEGKQLSLTEAKEQVSKDLKLKKTKKSAQKAYIAFKKGKVSESEKITLSLGDLMLTPDIWDILKEKNIGDILKPKIISDMYATIKIENIIASRLKTFDEAKKEVSLLYTAQAKKKALLAFAEKTLKNFNPNDAIQSDFVKLEKNVKLESLNQQESLQFLQKLFTSTKEKGIISLRDKTIVYEILEQKFSSVDNNMTETFKETIHTLKENIFESNLIKTLQEKYPTKTYMEGLRN